MSNYRKLRVLLNTKQPRSSRVVDARTGEEIPVSDLQIHIGHSTKYQLKVQITMEDPFIEVIPESPDDPLGIGALVKQ